jgi:hypothetical protein
MIVHEVRVHPSAARLPLPVGKRWITPWPILWPSRWRTAPFTTNTVMPTRAPTGPRPSPSRRPRRCSKHWQENAVGTTLRVTQRPDLQHDPHEGKVQICNATSSMSPHQGVSATPATHVCSACGHGFVALQREEGRWERPPWPGMAHQRPLASPRDCTRVHVSCDVPLAHRAGQAIHPSASSSKVGSGMPACQVGSRNSSRLPLGSKKYSSRPGKTPSFR